MTRKVRMVLFWLLLISATLYIAFFSYNDVSPRFNMDSVCSTSLAGGSYNTDDRVLQFAVITCFGPRKGSQIWSKHLRQLRVLFKSMALLTSATIQINIVSPESPSYLEITNITYDWPKEYKKRITFGELRRVYYPSGLEDIRNHYRTCATERLFLPEVFKDLDSIIFVDTDAIFMQPPEDLWEQFSNFEERQISGIASCLNRYGRNFKTFPAYGFSGLNAGIILMNLTRMRSFHKGWVTSIEQSLRNHGKDFNLADQDILNNVFSGENEMYLHELGCEWNYRDILCSRDRNRCPAAASRGVALLHGCDNSFISNKEPTLKAQFNVWENYRMGSPVKELVSLLEDALSKPFTNQGCIKLSNIKDIYLKGLKRSLVRQGVSLE